MTPAGEGGGGEGQAFADSQAVVGVAEQGQREKEKADDIGVPRGSGDDAGLAGAPDGADEDAEHEGHDCSAEQAVAHQDFQIAVVQQRVLDMRVAGLGPALEPSVAPAEDRRRGEDLPAV